MSTRAEKLVALREFIDLQTGELHKDLFSYENQLYEKTRALRCLNSRIAKCRECDGLNLARFTDSTPAWGDPCSPIMFIGQSLHKSGILSGLPFILGSGYLIDAALRLSGLRRKDVMFTNVVHCHPPNNRESLNNEKLNCLPFLRTEIEIIRPKLIVALGNDAKWALLKLGAPRYSSLKIPSNSYQTPKIRTVYFKHPASFFYRYPERRVDWVLKLSKELDKYAGALLASRPIVDGRTGERFAGETRRQPSGDNESLPQSAETSKALLKSIEHLKAGKYKTIYIDPPWPEVGGGKIKRGADKHYKLMSVMEIRDYVGSLVNLLAGKRCHIYLWATNNYMPDAYDIIKHWGLDYITTITWQKDRKGLGQYYRGKTEHCIFARKGILPYRSIGGKRAQGVTGFIEARTKHSIKPKTMREMIELVSYPPRLELFAREQHEGWDVWGDEV